MDPSTVGMMEGVYFVSKRELLEWLRNELQISINKIEECGTGVVYLTILDKLFPGKVPLKKVKFNARQEWECLHNLKIVQSVFQECNLRKHIDIDKLAKCGHLDNLEFLQWMKFCYDRYVKGRGDSGGGGLGVEADALPPRPPSRFAGGRPGTRPTTAAARRPAGEGAARALFSPGPRCGTAEITRMRDSLDELRKENALLREDLETAESESRFYYGKLRKLEVMSGEEGRSTFTVSEVQDILFTEEDVSESICNGGGGGLESQGLQ